MTPEITIITVAYNSEKTIERTILSVLNQSFKNYEYIIVDGESTDRTNEIINRYKPKFNNNLLHISEPDKGIYDAMNKGIANAQGKLIGILNSDDYYFDTSLAVIHKAYINSDQKSVLSGEIIFKNGDKKQLLKTSEKRFLKKTKQFKNGLRHPATFIPKSIYDTLGLFNLDYKIASDAELIFRIYQAKYSFLFIHQPLVIMSDGGISNSKGIIKQIVLEKRLLLDAFCSNAVARWYYITETKVRFKLKELAGTLLAKYRRISNN